MRSFNQVLVLTIVLRQHLVCVVNDLRLSTDAQNLPILVLLDLIVQLVIPLKILIHHLEHSVGLSGTDSSWGSFTGKPSKKCNVSCGVQQGSVFWAFAFLFVHVTSR